MHSNYHAYDTMQRQLEEWHPTKINHRRNTGREPTLVLIQWGCVIVKRYKHLLSMDTETSARPIRSYKSVESVV